MAAYTNRSREQRTFASAGCAPVVRRVFGPEVRGPFYRTEAEEQLEDVQIELETLQTQHTASMNEVLNHSYLAFPEVKPRLPEVRLLMVSLQANEEIRRLKAMVEDAQQSKGDVKATWLKHVVLRQRNADMRLVCSAQQWTHIKMRLVLVGSREDEELLDA